ncbi:hypothetical protein [Neobacillus sp. 19]
MYVIIFTSILVLALITKIYKLLKNKRCVGDYKDLDDELVILLSESDSID